MVHQTFGRRTSGPGIDRAVVAALGDEHLDWRFKALPPEAWGRTAQAYSPRPRTSSDLGTPLLTLDAGALDHNLRTMAAWCREAGVALAPHGKTTMAPALWQAQLDAGAVGITLANLPQLHVARAFGVQRLMLANSLLDPAGLAWIAAELAADPDFAFACWADSVDTVTQMDAALHAAGVGTGPDPDTDRPIEVLVELGAPRRPDRSTHRRRGRRRRARRPSRADAAARGRRRVRRLAGPQRLPRKPRRVRAYLRDLAELHRRLAPDAYETDHPVVTQAAARISIPSPRYWSRQLPNQGGEVVLRSGAYVIHDDGFYRGISPLSRAGTARSRTHLPSGHARLGPRRLAPRAEPLPPRRRQARPPLRRRPADPRLVRGVGAVSGVVTALNDQHAFLRDAGDTAPVGAVLRLGLSHPCTAFDKWTLIPVLDDADSADPKVVDLVRTFF